MEFVAGGVAVEFLQPPGAPVRRRGAVFAATMPMPETAVNKNRNAMLGQKNVRADRTAHEYTRPTGWNSLCSLRSIVVK